MPVLKHFDVYYTAVQSQKVVPAYRYCLLALLSSIKSREFFTLKTS